MSAWGGGTRGSKGATAFGAVGGATKRVSPDYPNHLFRRAVPTTPADRAGALVDCFPAHAAFRQFEGERLRSRTVVMNG
jgi:hypothetical protein